MSEESEVSLSARGFNSIIIMGRHPHWDLEPSTCTQTHVRTSQLLGPVYLCAAKPLAHPPLLVNNVQVVLYTCFEQKKKSLRNEKKNCVLLC